MSLVNDGSKGDSFSPPYPVKANIETDLAERTKEETQRAYERCAGAIFVHLLYLVRDEASAQELLQETFIRFLVFLKRGKTINYPYAFLLRISTRLAYKRMRSESQRRIRETDSSRLEAPDRQWRSETWSLLRNVWDRLKPKDQIVAKALVMDEMTPSEIVKHTGFSWGSVQRRVKKIQTLAKKINAGCLKAKKK